MVRFSALSLRYFSVVLIALVLLAKTGLIVHEIEHAIAGDNEHCVSCLLAENQHSYVSDEITLTSAFFVDDIADSIPYLFLSPHFNHYTSRAPPLAFFS